jgi:hypothetical protein
LRGVRASSRVVLSTRGSRLTVETATFYADFVFEHGSKSTDARGPAARKEPVGRAASDGAVIQRKCEQCDDDERAPLQRKEAPSQQPSSAATSQAIVDDGSPLAPGQMHRSAFMGQVRASVTGMCNAELAVVGRSAEGCPYIQHYLDSYDRQPAASLVRTIQRYAGASPNADAPMLMGALLGRVRGAVRTWVATGQTVGAPVGVNPADPSAPPPAEDAGPSGPGLFAKRERGGGASADPGAVRSSLGAGHGLDGGIRGRMESAFGQSFGDVRVHTGGTAADWNTNLAARAFTVGTDVAFGRGEYQPGTLEGDVLIAHELAHVAQQRGGAVPAAKAGDHGLEMEADRAAAAALGLLPQDQARLPAGRGLSLQRCSEKKEGPKVRPGMGLDAPLGPGEDTRERSLDEYIDAWEKRQGRKMTDEERKRLAAGCVGITRLNLGGAAPIDECYTSFYKAKRRADELQKDNGNGQRPFIYSKRFWMMGKAFPADSTGKVDMSNDDGSHPPGDVNFDYGWYDETTDSWWHANHCDPATGTDKCKASYPTGEPMKVHQSKLDHYSDPNYFGADKQVFCVAWSKLK